MDEADEAREIMDRQKEEIERLKSALTNVSDTTGLEQKYLEALRKAKAINVKYECEKVKAEKLARRVIDLEQKATETERVQTCDGSEHSATSEGSKSPKHKEKIAGLQKTNADLKQKNTALRTEVQKMKEIFKKETGLETPSATEEGWRGRAQTISLLKDKIKDLQRTIQNQNTIAPSDSASVATYATGYTGTTRDFNDANRRALSEVSAARRVKETETQQKCQKMEAKLQETTHKNTAQQARIIALESEVSNLKVSFSRVITKTENDDKLIEAYKAELSKATTEGTTPREPFPENNSDSVSRLEEQLGKKDELIQALSEVVSKLESQTPIEGGVSEYTLLLKSQLTAERERCQAFEEQLLAERQKKGTTQVPHVPFDTSALPQPVIEHLSMLKGEATSLKERLYIMKQNHQAELSVLTAELEAAPQQGAEVDAHPTLASEHEDLKAQYRELKMAFNRIMQQEQMQQQG